MPPRSIQALLDMLLKNRTLDQLLDNLITQWGPANRPMRSMDLLPPRRKRENSGTEERVHIRTILAPDGTRHSPAQLVGGGQLFGKVSYELGNSDVAREIVGDDYEGIVRYLNRSMPMEAAARVVGLFGAMIVQSLVEHDELANWQAILDNQVVRRGSNGYVETVHGPVDLEYLRPNAEADWTDSTDNPWETDIKPAIRRLTGGGFERGGIRVYTTQKILETLADHPATARLLASNPTASDQTSAEYLGMVTEDDVIRLLRQKFGVQSVVTHDLRALTIDGALRFFTEGNMAFIGSTGVVEEVIYNEDDPTDVRMVMDTIGYTGIGRAAGEENPGRKYAMNSFLNQKDKRIEFQAWQTTGPVILEPQAITVIKNIETGAVV